MFAALSRALLPKAFAETSASTSEPVEEAPKPAPIKKKGLSAAEIEEVKEELLQEMLAEIAGEDGEKLDEFIVPKIVTAPYDPRFPNANQARHCFIRYNEYYKCVYERSEEDQRCQFYKRAFETVCPDEWKEGWQELRDKGIWPGKY